MAKTKSETVNATDETTLPIEGQMDAPAPVVEGADIPQGDMGIPMSAEGDAPEGTPVADEPVPVVDTAPDADPAPSETLPEGANIHGIGPDVGGGPNPDYNPDADPQPPETQPADPVAQPDADLLRNLIASIERRNTEQHRPALLGELAALGAQIEGQSIVLACVRAEAVSEDEGLLLTNWCMSARQQLAVIADV